MHHIHPYTRCKRTTYDASRGQGVVWIELIVRRQEADPATLAELASKSGNPPYDPQHTIGIHWTSHWAPLKRSEKEPQKRPFKRSKMVKDGQGLSKVAEQTSEI